MTARLLGLFVICLMQGACWSRAEAPQASDASDAGTLDVAKSHIYCNTEELQQYIWHFDTIMDWHDYEISLVALTPGPVVSGCLNLDPGPGEDVDAQPCQEYVSQPFPSPWRVKVRDGWSLTGYARVANTGGGYAMNECAHDPTLWTPFIHYTIPTHDFEVVFLVQPATSESP